MGRFATSTNDDDIGALFEARRRASQEKREHNRTESTTRLQEAGIYFTSHNEGAHLIVSDRWDFWPGTGRWRERRGRPGQAKREGRGVFRLIDIIKEENNGIGQ